MSANIFDKILKIVQVVVTILQFAVKSFFDVKDDMEEAEE